MEENIRETLFLKIINREIPAEIIYEDDKVIAFLDINPFEKGHTLLVPKKRFETIFDMDEENYLYLQKILLKLSKHIKNKLNCDLNIIQNNGSLAGQEIKHVHFHLVPRRVNKKILCENIRIKYQNNDELREYNKLLRLE